ncbi:MULTISPECIES: hypothetical protein [Planktothricoides]|uniref:CpcD n=1 Tax=Planktothricoides raciborskii FACHB-1370 TaxID=2949576 RepID=A0ABR8EJX0_9CYAN|nr:MULTISPECIES: hypothetical protein [Planktothricoides]MBD2546953.1 hypothetical protein [Planktothricoides raciborskii FACHB-1370]MBD2585864.1 hypothetical protein [Planktothricoides raciborskii FACHB-1261]
MPKLEQRFDYVKIGLASPDRIREWGERILPAELGLCTICIPAPPYS